jgi:hypothetical protein
MCGITKKEAATDIVLPGVYNPNVTQDNINQTICVKGWTATIRPPESYTEALKKKQMDALGLPGKPEEYEEDHFIPLELGGHPTDPNNLWPQLWDITNPCSAHIKDKDENDFREAVCASKQTLAAARTAIADKWEHCKRP